MTTDTITPCGRPPAASPVPPFSKTLRPGTVPCGRSFASLFIKIKWDGARLSLSGVVGPTDSGNARGGCGQVAEELRHVSKYASNWTPALARKLRAVWERWHLNDLHPGCAYQRTNWDADAPVGITTWRLAGDKHAEQARLRARLAADVAAGLQVQATPAEVALLALPFEQVLPIEAAAPDFYVEKGRRTERAGWVHPSQHPGGLLTKPCPVCGFEYGSARLRETPPEDVLTWLRDLPDTDRKPAWV